MKTETPTAEEIIKKHTEKPDADYSNSWVKRAMEEYASIKIKALENEYNHLHDLQQEACKIAADAQISNKELLEAMNAYKDYAKFLGDYEQSIAPYLHVHRMGPSADIIKTGEAMRRRISKATEALEKHTPPVGVETK